MSSTKVLLKRREEKYRVKYYNKIAAANCSTLCDVPAPALELLAYLSYYDIIRPFVSEDLADGVPVALLKERYGVSRRYIEYLRTKYKIGH
jgi:hypothetical protein